MTRRKTALPATRKKQALFLPPPTSHMEAVAAVLRALRLSPQTSERAIGDAVEQALRQAGIAHIREYAPNKENRFDFFCPEPNGQNEGVAQGIPPPAPPCADRSSLRQGWSAENGVPEKQPCGLVLELKRAAKAYNLPQFARYLACETVTGLILLSEKTVDLQGLSAQFQKPCLRISLWQGWGIAL